MSGRIVAIYEDRPKHLLGVKLLVLSLERYNPELAVVVSVPNISGELADWVDGRPYAITNEIDLEYGGWDAKPAVLVHHLTRGADEVIWLDSDVIVTDDIVSRLEAGHPEALVAAEDVWWGRRQGTADRTTAWGMNVGALLPVTANTAIIRAQRQHVPFLEEWMELLRRPDYRIAQSRPWDERPLAMVGDQEAFTALLGARQWRFLPRRLLRRGLDIVQSYSPGSGSTDVVVGGLSGQ